MKQGSHQSAVAFVAFLVVLSAGARLFRPDPAPVLPADAAGVDLAAYRVEAQRALDAEAERTRPLAAGERIAVNRASVDELARLPGVGAGLAVRIVEEREKGGGFRTTKDLTRVSGIGERTAARLAKHLDFSGAGPASAAWAASTPATRASLAPPASRYDPPGRESGGPATVRGSGHSPGTGTVRPARGGGGVVDVNRADAAQLQQLPGIGPVIARRIIAYRDSVGPFRAVDDLVAVPGIGPATLKRIRASARAGGG